MYEERLIRFGEAVVRPIVGLVARKCVTCCKRVGRISRLQSLVG